MLEPKQRLIPRLIRHQIPGLMKQRLSQHSFLSRQLICAPHSAA